MNILIVEDDSFKLKKINDYICSTFPNLNIKIKDNVRDAVIYLKNETQIK